MVNVETIQQNYPLHWLVWNNNYVELAKELSTNSVCKDLRIISFKFVFIIIVVIENFVK